MTTVDDVWDEDQPLAGETRRSTAKLLQFVEDPGHAEEVAEMELDIDLELTDLLEAEEILARLQNDLLAPRDDMDGGCLADKLPTGRREELDSLLNDLVRRWLGSFKLALAHEVDNCGSAGADS